MSRSLYLTLIVLMLLVTSCQAAPIVVPTNSPVPDATENIPFPMATDTQEIPTQMPTIDVPSPVSPTLAPDNVAIQGGSLGEAHIAYVEEQPYENTSGPRIYGLPAHIEIRFGETPDPLYFGHYPILTIIPIQEYIQMWSDNGDPIVAMQFAAIQELINNPPVEVPSSQLPVLPLDAVQAVIDIVAQYQPLNTNLVNGYRFVGRLSQGINPVINANLYYFYIGLSHDDKYIITLMVPVKSSALVDRIEDLPAADNDLLNSDYMQYMQSIRDRLNQQTGSDFQPALDELDRVVQSLTFQ